MGYASGPSAYDKVIPSTLDQKYTKARSSEAASKDVVLFLVDLTKITFKIVKKRIGRSINCHLDKMNY
jgi:hypothetical protein